VEQRGRDLDALVELVYAESGAADVDARLVELGRELFTGEGKCAMCHEIDGTSAADIGPNLGGRGSLEMLAEFIGRPDHPRWFGDEAEMPSFYDKYDGEARRELAELLVHLGAKTVPKAPPPR
jgi:mono/diheme cytochrome c family protein